MELQIPREFPFYDYILENPPTFPPVEKLPERIIEEEGNEIEQRSGSKRMAQHPRRVSLIHVMIKKSTRKLFLPEITRVIGND